MVPISSADLRYDLAHFQNSSSNFFVPLGLNLRKLSPEYLCATKIKSDDFVGLGSFFSNEFAFSKFNLSRAEFCPLASFPLSNTEREVSL